MLSPVRSASLPGEPSPSWYLIATQDKMIPLPAQRQVTTRVGATVAEAAGSHAIYISKPEAVAALIAKAAKSVKPRIAVSAEIALG
jgi:hypothetical protein